jgi:hypothetical protein
VEHVASNFIAGDVVILFKNGVGLFEFERAFCSNRYALVIRNWFFVTDYVDDAVSNEGVI